MLEVVDIEYIRKKYYVEGWSIRKISKQLGYARQTIRKALASSKIPEYELTKDRPCPVMDPYREIILNWLRQDEKAPKKQRHTAKRIYDRLVEEYGFQGSDSTVRKYVRKLRPVIHEVHIPLYAAYGEQAQVDWGRAKVIIRGRLTEVCLFCLRMKASKVPFVWAFHTEKLEAFLEGHRLAFEWLGGVPTELVYDNPKTAVVKILGGPKRQEHLAFASLRAHYLFDSIFCRPGEPHEKGSVEGLLGYVRRNALVPMPDVPDIDYLNNEILLKWCQKELQRHSEEWEQEKSALRPLPAYPFRCCVAKMAKANSYSLVNYERVRYSVPCRYVKETLRLEIFAERIEVWHKNQLVAYHRRSYKAKDMLLELDHYLDALERKPRAVMHAAVVRRLPEVYARAKEKLMHGNPEGYRELCRILLLHRHYSQVEVASALKQALALGSVNEATVKQLLINRANGQAPPKVEVPAALNQYRVSPSTADCYDVLLGVAR